jgi:hypothetical protein
MNHNIHLSAKAEQHLHQMCDPPRKPPDSALNHEDFLSALVEEQLGQLFTKYQIRQKRAKSLLVAEERARCWRTAIAATEIALDSVRKLVIDAISDKGSAPRPPKKKTPTG